MSLPTDGSSDMNSVAFSQASKKLDLKRLILYLRPHPTNLPCGANF